MLASNSYPVEQHLETVCITVKVFFVVEKRPDPTTGTPHPGWTAHPLINVCIDPRSWTIYRHTHVYEKALGGSVHETGIRWDVHTFPLVGHTQKL